MIEAEVIACPCGELEGAPSLRVRASGVVVPEMLLQTLATNERPGVSVLWVEQAPWGTADWDTAIRLVAESPRFTHVAICAMQALNATRWSGFPKIRWTIDITALLREPLTEEGLVQHLEEVAYVPAVQEIVVFRPAAINLQPAILDPLYQYLNPIAGGYVYVEAAKAVPTMHALTRCTNPWSQRYWRPDHG